MINRLFSLMSQGSGVAFAAMVVGTVSLHVHNGAADAGISSRPAVVDGKDAAVSPVKTNTIKTGPILGMFNPGHPWTFAMFNPGHPLLQG